MENEGNPKCRNSPSAGHLKCQDRAALRKQSKKRSENMSASLRVNGDVGELDLGPDETSRAVKVRLRRAATRLGKDIESWDANGRVYFRLIAKRGRPRKTS